MRKKLGMLLKDSVLLNTLYNAGYKVKNKKKFFMVQEQRKSLSLFDYKKLADPIPFYPLEFVKDSNFYGQNYWIKNYTGLSHINAAIEHGLYYGDYIPYTSYCKTVTKILTFSAVRERVLKKTNKPVIAIGPYIHYVPYLLGEEDFLNIKKQYGKILLFFPKHTTREGGQKFSIETIIDALKNIAVQYGFQSVFVCMYYYDILHSNFASLYEHAGFKVVTAGHQLDLNFLPRLKSIISLADYTVSNAIGTHTGYCIYMGKVHSIINPINYLDMPQDFIEITKAFLPFSSTIEKKQYDMVAKYWGIDLLKKPEELKLLLEK